MAEHRRSPRYGFLKHIIQVDGVVVGYLEDLTLSGAGLVLTKAPEIGDKINFTIKFHSRLGLTALKLEAVICWKNPFSSEAEKVGVKFGLLDNETQSIIKRYGIHAKRVRQNSSHP